MSDLPWLLPSELDSIDDVALPMNETAGEDPVQVSNLSDYLQNQSDQEENAAPAGEEWDRMRLVATGKTATQDVANQNFYHDSVGMANNGIIYVTYQSIPAVAPGRKTSSVVIEQEWLKKSRRVYVIPPRHRDALRLLVKRRVAVLICEQHTGKQSAALNLLLGRRLDEIRRIDPNIDLADDQSFTFEQRCGYQIDGLSLASAQKLTTFTLDRLSSNLKAQDSYLVITVNCPFTQFQGALGDYAIAWDEVPERQKTLWKHIVWYLKKDEALLQSAQQRCQEPAVKRVFDSLHPAEIDKLARLLADVEIGRLSSTSEALNKFAADPNTLIADWFRVDRKLEEYTFLISLAVLNGARYQSILAADTALQARVANAPDLSSVAMGSVFDSTHTNLLREVNARIILSEEEARFGRVLAERVELEKHEYRAVMLAYIWREFDGLRKPLLDWLRTLGLKNVPGVRELVAGAVAQFAQYDLGEVRWAVLQHWARHADNRVRRAAALTIDLLASNPQYSPYALDLLANWSQLRNNRRLCWTAAAAYSGLLDPQFWDVSLQGLGNVADAGDAHLLHVINRGVANLFQAAKGQPLACGKIFDALERWTANTKTGKSTPIGLLIFVDLAHAASFDEPPRLLQLSASPECGQQIHTLWRRALNHPVARTKAIDALRVWLDAADIDATLLSAVQQLIGDLVREGDEREQQRLLYWLDRWARDPKRPCPSAASIRLNMSSGAQAKEAYA